MARIYLDDFESGNLNKWDIPTTTLPEITAYSTYGSKACQFYIENGGSARPSITMKHKTAVFKRGDSLEVLLSLSTNADGRYSGIFILTFGFDFTAVRGYSLQFSYDEYAGTSSIGLYGHNGSTYQLTTLGTTDRNRVSTALKGRWLRIAITTTTSQIQATFYDDVDTLLATLTTTNTAYNATAEFKVGYQVVPVGTTSATDSTTYTVDEYIPNEPPTTPGEFTSPLPGEVLLSGRTYRLSWGASTDPEGGAIRYSVYQSINGVTPYTKIVGDLTNTYYDLVIPTASKISFYVSAKDSAGNLSLNSMFSSEFMVENKTQIGTYKFTGKTQNKELPLYDPSTIAINCYRAYTSDGRPGCFDVQDLTGDELIRLTGKTKIRGIKK